MFAWFQGFYFLFKVSEESKFMTMVFQQFIFEHESYLKKQKRNHKMTTDEKKFYFVEF